ncbi:MAG: alpha/beta hydrolase family esterase [Acidimicrobiia bacterium]
MPVSPGAESTSETGSAGGREYGLRVPPGHDDERESALVVLLHGYGANGEWQDDYFGLSRLGASEGFLVALPEGTTDPSGRQFWNATDACCDFYGSGVDDVAYLDAVLDDVAERYEIDEQRVFLVGHSNGAFMSHRFACDRSGRVAAIVALAGMQWSDASRCEAASPVAALHVHGSDDLIVRYEGGATPAGTYPGAKETVGTWAAKNDCAGDLSAGGESLDLDRGVPGAETAVERYPECPAGAAELWTIEGGRHIPAFDDTWAEALWDFLDAHPQPPQP